VRALLRPDPYPGFLLSAQPCQPESRGSIRLRSMDPNDAPVIAPNSLSAARDLDELVEGARLLRRLAATPSLSAIIVDELRPGTKADSHAAIRHALSSMPG
jgi:choline dehydrogenase